MATRVLGLAGREWAWVSTAVGLATTAVYIGLISDEGDNPFWEVAPWVLIMVIGMGAMLTSALVDDPRVSRAFAIAGTLVLGAVGVVSMFSVGLGFVVAAGAGVLASVQAARHTG